MYELPLMRQYNNRQGRAVENTVIGQNQDAIPKRDTPL